MKRTNWRPSHATVVAYLALFVALATGSAWAAATIGPGDIKDNAVHTRHIKRKAVEKKQIAKGAVSTNRLADGAVTGQKTGLDTLTGDNIIESSLGQVPDADRVDGFHATSFIQSNVYKSESAIAAGTSLGDGTFYIDQPCGAGDRLLTGGPANVNATSTMVESFPTPGSTNSWRSRINKNGAADNFSTVVLCADQP
jgi:hypothetical protein